MTRISVVELKFYVNEAHLFVCGMESKLNVFDSFKMNPKTFSCKIGSWFKNSLEEFEVQHSNEERSELNISTKWFRMFAVCD